MWGAYFCMGAYKHVVVVVIKMGAYIHGCLFCVDAYYPDFAVCSEMNGASGWIKHRRLNVMQCFRVE